MRPGPFGVALGVVLVVSLLPASWISPWSRRASELVGLPLVPLGDGWMAVRYWLVRPAEPTLSTETAAVLEEENRLLRLGLNEAMQQVEDLKRQLELYQGEEVSPGRRVRFVEARLVGGEPHASGEMLVRVNAGSARGVRPGSQVVARKDILLGEVVQEGVGRTVSLIRPLTSPHIGLFEGQVLRDGETSVHAEDELRPRGLVTPEGDGWNMDLATAASAGIRPGNEVAIVDSARRDAFGLRFGRVVSWRVDPGNAQWCRVRIEPLLPLDQVHSIEIRIPVSGADDEEGGA